MSAHMFLKTFAVTCLGFAFLITGCGDSTGPEDEPLGEQVFVIVNSTENSLSLVPVSDTIPVRVIGMAGDAASPVSLAVHGTTAVVPLGLAHAVSVVDLVSGSVERTIALEQNSGATGAAMESDSIAWVANPSLNTVTRVNLNTGDTSSVAVGVYPQAVAYASNRIWVANANLVMWAPAGPSWLTVIDPATSQVVDSVGISGQNSAAMELGEDGFLYVVNSGNFGAGDGSLSVVDPVAESETDYLADIGEFPGSVAWVSDDLLVIGSFGEGILEVDPTGPTLTRAGAQGFMPEGAGVSGLAADTSGMVYALNSTDCVSPGRVNVLSPPGYTISRAEDTGVCPYAIERVWIRE